MKVLPGVRGVQGAAPRDERAELRRLSRQLEGVFVRQLIAAMRQSVPQAEGLASPGQEAFTGLLDDALADLAAQRMQRGVGEALYRQMSRRLAPEDVSPAK